VALGVTRVGMEATGVDWKPVLYVLEDELDCWLLNARHMRNVPGRKTDVADAEWICQLTEHGLVRASFVPPPEIRDIRELTRYRRTVVEERSREAQRLDKVLQDAGIKLSSVASDILGASGRAMLTAAPRGPIWPPNTTACRVAGQDAGPQSRRPRHLGCRLAHPFCPRHDLRRPRPRLVRPAELS